MSSVRDTKKFFREYVGAKTNNPDAMLKEATKAVGITIAEGKALLANKDALQDAKNEKDFLVKFIKAGVGDPVEHTTTIAKEMGITPLEAKGIYNAYKNKQLTSMLDRVLIETGHMSFDDFRYAKHMRFIGDAIERYEPQPAEVVEIEIEGGAGGGGGPPEDPPCHEVFTLVKGGKIPSGLGLDSMKRSFAYNYMGVGEVYPYAVYNKGSMHFREVKPQADYPDDYFIFKGNLEITSKSHIPGIEKPMIGVVHLPIPTPAPGWILLDYNAINMEDDSEINLTFEIDENENLYALSGEFDESGDVIDFPSVKLEWKVAVPNIMKNYYMDTNMFPRAPLPATWVSIPPKNHIEYDKIHENAQKMMVTGVHLGGFANFYEVVKVLKERILSYRCPQVESIPNEDFLFGTFSKKIGICRHRALDFMAVALEMGVPCRYVSSDCHAWVEVLMPKLGVDGKWVADKWVGINLSGCHPPEIKNKDRGAGGSGNNKKKQREQITPPHEEVDKLENRKDLSALMQKEGIDDWDAIKVALKAFVDIGGKL